MATKAKIDPFITDLLDDFQAQYGKKVSKDDIVALNAAYRLGMTRGKKMGRKEMALRVNTIFNRIDLR